MARIVEIKLGEYRPVLKFEFETFEFDRDQMVVLDVDRGKELARVVSTAQGGCKGKADVTDAKFVRLASPDDFELKAKNRFKAQEALVDCEKKIREQKLDMQLVKAEYILDSSKVIFYFTADGRVDFRNLVKELARLLKVRIELKQIGVRDKAKVIGGFGVCGRELCCSSFLKSFHALSIKMPKEQNLPLNPTRISGVCGRIKCCMAYEYQVYREYARDLPSVGDQIDTDQGKGQVVEINILKRYVSVDLGEGKVTKVAYASKYEI